MKAFRRIYKFYESREWTKRLMIGITESWNRTFLLQSVKKRKLSYYGHVLRKEGNCMEKEISKVLLLVEEEEEDQEHVGRIT